MGAVVPLQPTCQAQITPHVFVLSSGVPLCRHRVHTVHETRKIQGDLLPLTTVNIEVVSPLSAWSANPLLLRLEADLPHQDVDHNWQHCPGFGHPNTHYYLRTIGDNMYCPSIDDAGESRISDMDEYACPSGWIDIQRLLSKPVHDELPPCGWRGNSTCI